jgi:hypothetical protein
MKNNEFIDSKNKDQNYVKSHSFLLNPQDNGGESIILQVDYYLNNDGYAWNNIRFELNCYGIHSAKIELGTIRPELLESIFKHINETNSILHVNLEEI